MTDTNVVSLPGVFRPEFEASTPVRDILEMALDHPLQDIIVIGRVTGSSGHFIASSHPDADKVVGQLMRVVAFLAGGEQVAE